MNEKESQRKEKMGGDILRRYSFRMLGWVRCIQYSPNGLLVACGMGGETDGMSSDGLPADMSVKKRHSPREEDGTIKIVSGKLFNARWDVRDNGVRLSCIFFRTAWHMPGVVLSTVGAPLAQRVDFSLSHDTLTLSAVSPRL